MKKTIALTHPKLNPARWVDAIKHDIKKYLRRERNKTLPKGAAYWTFDCRFGATEDTAEEVFTSDLNKHIDTAVVNEWAEFYVEILARAAHHEPKVQQVVNNEDDVWDE